MLPVINFSHVNQDVQTEFSMVNNTEDSVSPQWGSLPIEKYMLLHHEQSKWDPTSTLPINQQRDQLVQAFLQEDDISPFASSALGITSQDMQELIQTVLVPWRPQKLRRIAEKHLPGTGSYGNIVVLRTYYGGINDDQKFRCWIYEAAATFEEDNPMGDLFGESDDHWWRILDDASLFDMGTQDWQSIYNILPELASSDLLRTFGDKDIAGAREEVSAVVVSREPEEDDFEDAIAHVAVSGCWLLVLDKEAFEDEEILLVFRDKKGNVVRQSSIALEDLEHIPHYIMRGSITESGFWRDAEVGKMYKTRGRIMRDILPRVMADSE
ncbi:hypothetical protein FBEOM_1501 [Fusarium beomiforme]|uniref:Uncharacterized protein n=1 Tax=Fusarium beomiforme TaxID=44412 RepID=A0A9P5E526_9HYPO|nr:hypothetical protein FBEOM_1501 [Fusarium beomiforme]